MSSNITIKSEIEDMYNVFLKDYDTNTESCLNILASTFNKYKGEYEQLSSILDELFLNKYKISSASVEIKDMQTAEEFCNRAKADMTVVQDCNCSTRDTAIRWSLQSLLFSSANDIDPRSLFSSVYSTYRELKTNEKPQKKQEEFIDSSNPYSVNPEIKDLVEAVSLLSEQLKELQIENADLRKRIDEYKSSITAITSAQADIPSGDVVTREAVRDFGARSRRAVESSIKPESKTQSQPEPEIIDDKDCDSMMTMLLKFAPKIFLVYLLSTLVVSLLYAANQVMGLILIILFTAWGYPALIKVTFNIIFSNGPFYDLLADKISDETLSKHKVFKFFKLAGIPKPKLYVVSALTYILGYLAVCAINIILYLIIFVIGTITYMQLLGVFKYSNQMAGSYQRSYINKTATKEQNKKATRKQEHRVARDPVRRPTVGFKRKRRW